MQISAADHVEVSITIDGVTHSLAWSPDGHVGLFRRERGELSTAGVGRWDGARLDLQRGGLRPDLRVALEGSLRLALSVRAASPDGALRPELAVDVRGSGSPDGALRPEPQMSTRAARLRTDRDRARAGGNPDAPAPRSGPGLASIDVVYEGDDIVCFRRAAISPA